MRSESQWVAGIYSRFAPSVHAHAQRGISVHIACSEPTSWYPGLLLCADKKESEGVLCKGPIWIQKFNAMVRFYLNTFLVVADACEGVNHK